MRIAAVSFYSPEEKTAASARLRRMVVFLRELGWEIEVICPKDPGARSDAAGLASSLIRRTAFLSRLLALTTTALKAEADVFFVSAPPISMLFPAVVLKLLKRAPLVFEERDPLTINPMVTFQLLRTNFLMRRIERWLLLRVHAIVVPTPLVKADLEKAWPVLAEKNPPRVVFNGFWRRDYEFLREEPGEAARTGPLRIIYSGNFYGTRNPRPLLKALEWIESEYPQWKKQGDLRFVFMGQIPTKSEREFLARKVAEKGWERLFEMQDPKPHQDALREVFRSDVSLLITHEHGSENALPAKLFEYIALERPILAITHDPLLRQAFESDRIGWYFDHDQTRELAEKLMWMVEHKEEVRKFRTPGLALSAYDAEAQLRLLKGIFEETQAIRKPPGEESAIQDH